MDIEEIREMLRDIIKPAPASIHYDLDKEGNVSAHISGRASDVLTLSTLIVSDILKKDPNYTIDEYCKHLKKTVSIIEKGDELKDCNNSDEYIEKFNEMFKDLGF